MNFKFEIGQKAYVKRCPTASSRDAKDRIPGSMLKNCEVKIIGREVTDGKNICLNIFDGNTIGPVYTVIPSENTLARWGLERKDLHPNQQCFVVAENKLTASHELIS